MCITFALLSISSDATNQLKCKMPNEIYKNRTCICKPYYSYCRNYCVFDCTAMPSNANFTNPNSGCKNNGICNNVTKLCICPEGFEGYDCATTISNSTVSSKVSLILLVIYLVIAPIYYYMAHYHEEAKGADVQIAFLWPFVMLSFICRVTYDCLKVCYKSMTIDYCLNNDPDTNSQTEQTEQAEQNDINDQHPPPINYATV